jgi:hypothetical protein
VNPRLGGPDPRGPARAQLNPKRAIFTASDDGGIGVGADIDWQFVGGLGVKPGWSLELKAGCRILSVDRQDGGLLFNVDQSGPFCAHAFGA